MRGVVDSETGSATGLLAVALVSTLSSCRSFSVDWELSLLLGWDPFGFTDEFVFSLGTDGATERALTVDKFLGALGIKVVFGEGAFFSELALAAAGLLGSRGLRSFCLSPFRLLLLMGAWC